MNAPNRHQPIATERLEALDRHFRAANYLSAAQLYLCDNALLERPLRIGDIKPRLLGHWGTTPGLNLVYTHLNRLIQDTGTPILQVVGPGHGAPSTLACLYLEGTLKEIYPAYGFGRKGLARLVHDFSWPGGFPSHLSAMVPGTIHEGGELGYSLLHACGAALDNPELVVACVIGDGEAETGPMAASWQSVKFLDPSNDGAVLPILHLNGYKISGPTIMARMDEDELIALFAAQGYKAHVVAGDKPMSVHREMWLALDAAHAEIRALQHQARNEAAHILPHLPPRWPMIILRTPKGWTGPAQVDGKPVEGSFRSHQIPIPSPRGNPRHLMDLEAWLRSYAPEELFDRGGMPMPEVTSCCPRGTLAMGLNPHANGGRLRVPLRLPDVRAYGVEVRQPGTSATENAAQLGKWLRDVFKENRAERNFRLFCPDETNSNRLGAVFEATARDYQQTPHANDVNLAHDGRVMEILSEHCCEGWLEGYLLSGRHGIFACYEAFVSIVDSMMFQYAKWQKTAAEVPWRAPVSALNFLLTSHVWEQDHNGYSHQGPTFINALLTRSPKYSRLYFPPDANCLLATMRHCLESRDRINLVVASKKRMPQWLDLPAAEAHCAAGGGRWPWAGDDADPHVVLCAIGDVPTREILAAATLLREHARQLRFRVVNIVDLLRLESRQLYPEAFDDDTFEALFTRDRHVVVAFHGYAMAVHELIHRRPDPERFHVHGYREQGTTTTPFDMTVVNGASRFHLAMAALHYSGLPRAEIAASCERFRQIVEHHRQYIVEHGDDLREVAQWTFEMA